MKRTELLWTTTSVAGWSGEFMNQTRILLLSDDDRSRREYRETLERAGYRVYGSAFGAAGGDVVSARPQVILADLPSGGGSAEAVACAETASHRHDAAVVLVTDAVDVQEVRTAACADGPMACLARPVTPDLLLAAVEVGVYRGLTASRLREARKAAEAADRAKISFLSTISHELRTPMNGVLGMTELLLLSDLEEPYRENVQLIKDSSRSLLLVLNQIIDYSKLESATLTLREMDFRLEDLITGVLSQHGRAAASKGVSVVYELAPDVPGWVRGDSGKIRQVLGNLVGNAVKFTPAGEVRVDVALTAHPAGIELDDDALAVQVRVSDTGVGIPAARLEEIFDCFSQAEDPLSRTSGGLGLGLAIVSRLMTILGGGIHCASEEGQGSVFSFSIPLGRSRYELISPLAEVLSEERPLEGVRILVAEDDRISQRYMLAILKKMGCRVTLVGDGDQAVEALRRHSFDIVLMDVEMPGLNGIEATRLIRRPETGCLAPDVPIIALTAHAMWGDEQRCIHAGMDHYVAKPVDIDTVAAIIQSTVKR
jgi:signal transduction histidine kinase